VHLREFSAMLVDRAVPRGDARTGDDGIDGGDDGFDDDGSAR
jgi:hypothetical protein